MGSTNNGVWKLLASVLLTVVLTGSGFWVLLGKDTITRKEAKVMIAQAPYPWLDARGVIDSRLTNNERQIELIQSELKAMSQAIQEIRLLQVKIMVKLGITPIER